MVLEFANGQAQPAMVENNIFISATNPEIRVTVKNRFTYLGSFPFTIDSVASGYRYVFVQADASKHIRRMFIVQQEGFLPSSKDTYKYPITNPAALGGVEYQHSVFVDNNDLRIREEPGKEADLTQRFLNLHGYVLEPEVIMSRFARPADAQHRHEIIFFCFETLASYGHKLSDFPEATTSPEKETIKREVDENCRHTFRVNK